MLGTGRGDTALFHLGLPPMPVAEFFERTTRLQTYLAGGTIDIDGRESRIRWFDSAHAGKVPLDIAASGPKVIDFSARTAERITFALGADPDTRRPWGMRSHRAAADDAGRDPTELTFGFVRQHRLPPRPRRGPGDGARQRRRLRPLLVDAGIDGCGHLTATIAASSPRSAAVTTATSTCATTPPTPLRSPASSSTGSPSPGTPDRVVERLQGLAALGIDRFVVTGPGFGADRDDARLATNLLTTEVLPALAST